MYTEKQKAAWRHVHSRFGFEICNKVQDIKFSDDLKPVDELKTASLNFIKNEVNNDKEFFKEYKLDKKNYNKIILEEFIDNYNDMLETNYLKSKISLT